MQVVFDINPLYPPRTGIGHYTARLAENLLQDDAFQLIGAGLFNSLDSKMIHALIKAGYPDQQTNQATPSLEKQLSAIEVLRNILRSVPLVRSVKQGIANRTNIRIAKQFPDAVFWVPNYICPPVDNPSVVTIHDLSHLRFKEVHPNARIKWLEKGLADSIERATKLIAVSEFTRQEIVNLFGAKEEKIQIVSPGVGPEFFQQYTEDQLNQSRKKYHLPENYLLSVGTLEPRKNLSGLLKAFQQLPKKLRSLYPLVLVGAKGWGHNRLDEDVERLERQGELLRLGYVPQNELPLVYKNATLLAYMSIYEGFGMPIAEAMAAGVPVVCSDISAMPEVAKDTALLANPHAPESIAECLQRLIEEPEFRKKCISSGRIEAKEHTWTNSAIRLKEILLGSV